MEAFFHLAFGHHGDIARDGDQGPSIRIVNPLRTSAPLRENGLDNKIGRESITRNEIYRKSVGG
jgi:hypothetical protein